jgi:hypothetical protein
MDLDNTFNNWINARQQKRLPDKMPSHNFWSFIEFIKSNNKNPIDRQKDLIFENYNRDILYNLIKDYTVLRDKLLDSIMASTDNLIRNIAQKCRIEYSTTMLRLFSSRLLNEMHYSWHRLIGIIILEGKEFVKDILIYPNSIIDRLDHLSNKVDENNILICFNIDNFESNTFDCEIGDYYWDENNEKHNAYIALKVDGTVNWGSDDLFDCDDNKKDH